MLLTVAILPMVGMFDAGLRAAVLGSNYDTARALAKKQLEGVQSLSYNTVENNFPDASPTVPCTFDGSGFCQVANRQDSEFAGFRYTIRKQYVEPNTSNPANITFGNTASDKGMMRVTAIVCWRDVDTTCGNGNGNEYGSTTLKTR
jgi:hypothetical protein